MIDCIWINPKPIVHFSSNECVKVVPSRLWTAQGFKEAALRPRGSLFFTVSVFGGPLFPEITQEIAVGSNCTDLIPSLHHSTFYFASKPQRCLDPTVTLHYFHWPTTQPDMHTKLALRLQSSSHLGDTNGMIDTNVSRASCAADLHRSDRGSYPSNHLACWQKLLCVFGVHEWLLLYFQARCLCLPYAVWMACLSIITY